LYFNFLKFWYNHFKLILAKMEKLIHQKNDLDDHLKSNLNHHSLHYEKKKPLMHYFIHFRFVQ